MALRGSLRLLSALTLTGAFTLSSGRSVLIRSFVWRLRGFGALASRAIGLIRISLLVSLRLRVAFSLPTLPLGIFIAFLRGLPRLRLTRAALWPLRSVRAVGGLSPLLAAACILLILILIGRGLVLRTTSAPLSWSLWPLSLAVLVFV